MRLAHDPNRPASANGAIHHQPVSGKARCSASAQTHATAVVVTAAEVNVRRLGTAVVLAAMMAVLSGGCGRQVTGLNEANGGGVIPAGQTEVYFETNAQPDFQNFTYLIVFNTQGNNNEPVALGYNSNYKDYSFAIAVGGGYNYAAQPVLLQFYQNPQTSSGVQPIVRPYPTGALTFLPTIQTSNSPFGFGVRFNRCILDLPTPGPTPPPATNSCPPYQFIAPNWAINIFTVDNTNTVADSLGSQGASDTSARPFLVDTSVVINDEFYFKPAGGGTAQNPAAQIHGLELYNTP